MGTEFTFYDYVEDDVNVIRAWLNGIPKGARAKFTKWLIHLEAVPPGQWRRTLVDTLDDYCAGLFDIRVKLNGRQFRILGSHMGADRTPTLLHCFIKPGAKVPAADCKHANENKARVQADPARHRVEHNYGD